MIVGVGGASKQVAKASTEAEKAGGAIGTGLGAMMIIFIWDAQVAALEKKKEEQQSKGEIETPHPGYLGAQDTYQVGYIKGVGKIYQQTFIDTYMRVAFAKIYDRKNALAAADMLNDKVLPFYQEQGVDLLRILYR